MKKQLEPKREHYPILNKIRQQQSNILDLFLRDDMPAEYMPNLSAAESLLHEIVFDILGVKKIKK